MRISSIIGLVLFGFPAEDAQGQSPERWEKDIAAMESRFDQLPANPRVLFIGSSSIRMWDLKAAFPGRSYINHGFGGSEIADSNRYFLRAVVPVRPESIVLYAGDNDISRGKTPAIVAQDFLKFVALTEQHLGKETAVFFVAVKPSLKRWNLAKAMEEANARIRAECEKRPQLHYVDVWNPMLGDDGTPRPELFADDGLHLNVAGYALWNRLMQEAFDAATSAAATPL